MEDMKFSRKQLKMLPTLAVVVLMLIFSAAPGAAQGSGFDVNYKLDPRLTRGIFLGTMWASPPLYDIISGTATYTIEARAQVDNPYGIPKLVSAEWVSTDTSLVTVTRTASNTVALRMLGQGETRVRVTRQGVSTTLYITAAYHTSDCTNLRVQVSQTSQPDLPAQTCSLATAQQVFMPLIVRR